MEHSFDGRVAVITGAGGVLCSVMAKALAEAEREQTAAAYELEHHDDGGKKSASDHSAQGLLVHFFLLLAAAPSWRMQRKIHLFTRRFAPCVRIYFAGKHTRMQVPFPSSLCSAIVPRCSCTACLTIESPSPVPPEALEWLLSTR